MRKFTALLIASLILAQTFYNLGVCAYWLANQNYIATELCENRSKPALHCDGKCYLRKKMAKAADDETPVNQSPAKSLKKFVDLSEFVVEEWRAYPVIKTTQAVLIPTIPGCTASPAADAVFHPPSCLMGC